jgi:methyl-accepting chemotaxis protein
VVQQNAASAEESSAAASELNGQAEELAAMIGSFRLEDADGREALAPRGAQASSAPAIRARTASRSRAASSAE